MVTLNSVTSCNKKDEEMSAVHNISFDAGIIKQLDVGKAPRPDELLAEAIKQAE